MKLSGQRGLQPVTLEGVTSVLVSSDDGTPLAVVAEYLPGRFSVKHCFEPGFRRALLALGYEAGPITVQAIAGPGGDRCGP